MSSLFGIGANGAASFYNGVATQSLRLDRGSAAYLSRTPAGVGNRKVFTLSFWVKRSKISVADTALFGVQVDGNNRVYARWEADDTFKWYFAIGGTSYDSGTVMKFRDTSSWYHIVVAVNMAGSGDTGKLKIYVNGVNQSVTYASTLPNADTAMNTANVHLLGKKDGAANYMDGYLAEVNFVDGTMLTPAAFGETKNGVWIPIAPSPTYGTNGYRLQFTSSAHDAPENEGTEDTDNIGADTSGEHNNWTAVDAIVASDCAMPDSPENNFATYNPLQIAAPSSSFFLSEGNLALTATNNSGYRNCSATFSPMGFKGYIEFVASALNHKIGIIADTTYPTNQDYANSGPQHVTLEYNGEVKFPNNGTSHRSASDHNLGTLAAGDVMGMAFDFTGTNRNVWFHRANTYGTASGGLGNPATGANPIVTASNLNSTGPYRFHFGINNGPVFRINFGQDGTFGGTETAQGNTDANGNGDFYYAVPSGFLALCSANLPEPTIGPNSLTQADDHFNTVLYNGLNSTAQDITVGLVPDLVWIKTRNAAISHMLYDSNRGATKFLQADATGAEGTGSDSLTDFDVSGGGFSLGADSSTTAVNNNGKTYVSWNWKANGGTTTTNDASSTGVGSIDSVYQANTTAGFSIVTYTGTGSAGTIAHGLGKAPNMSIIKPRNFADNWIVTYDMVDGSDDQAYLNLTNAGGSPSASYAVAQNATTLGLTNWNNVNDASDTYVAYCFHSVEGYSKMGSYTGNGSTNGSFVFTGFKPAWVMIKFTGSGSWVILDNARDATPNGNPNDTPLFPDGNWAEENNANRVVDFLSNGFKLRSSILNSSTAIMIYMAFAEAPFKYANAR